MKKCKDIDLEKITGGTNLSGALINSLTSLMQTILDTGSRLGSAIRRIAEGNMCPLD